MAVTPECSLTKKRNLLGQSMSKKPVQGLENFEMSMDSALRKCGGLSSDNRSNTIAAGSMPRISDAETWSG